jgi:uncharacterized coiled-coil protein SlyX
MNNDLEGFGQWRRTVDTRLGTLETRVAEQASLRAQMDQDMSELRVEFRAQRTLLQALHDTQQEHSATLSGHGVMLQEQGAMLQEHGVMLRDQGMMLQEHGVMLRDQGMMLQEHGAILRGHGAILQEHSVILRDHSAQLNDLRAGQQRIMGGVDAIREMLDRTLGSGN